MTESTSRLVERFVCITNRKLVADQDVVSALDRICAAWEPGTLLVQLREKDLMGRALWQLAAAAREVTARHGARLVVNDRVDVALAVGADGVHLPATGLPTRMARRLMGTTALIGVSCHSASDVAAHPGASYVSMSPVWESPGKSAPLGLRSLTDTHLALAATARVEAEAEAKAESAPRLVALGGIETVERARDAFAHGAHAVAGIRAFLSPDCGRRLVA